MCNGLNWIAVNPLLSAHVPSAISSGPHRAGGLSDPVWWVSASFSQPPFPACSEGVYVLHYQEIGRSDVFNSPCSRVLCLLPSHPSSYCSSLGYSVSYTPCVALHMAAPMSLLPAFRWWSNASAFPYPSSILPSAHKDSGTRTSSNEAWYMLWFKLSQ